MSIYLRELMHEDIKIINVWRNDKTLVDQLGSIFRYINIETDERWFEQYMNNRTSQIRCAIIEKETEKIIGVAYLINIDYINRGGEFSIFIGDTNNQGKGYGFCATIQILEHAFFNLNLNRVYLTVLEENIRAINTYVKCGFTEEGIIRQCLYKNGKYKNMKMMSILKEEFVDLYQKL